MAEPLRKDVKPRKKKKGPKPPEAESAAEPSGYPGDMKALGESISGTQPEIGHKDTGVGRRLRESPEYPPSAP